MSRSLVFTRKIEEDLSDKLKYLLEKKYQLPYTLFSNDIPYLEGLKDAGNPEIQTLIDAINKYEEVTLEYRC